MSRTGTPAGGKVPVEQKLRVVLAVLSGEMSLAEAARRHGTSAPAAKPARDVMTSLAHLAVVIRLSPRGCR